jgi:replicative DNA helicase
MEPNKQHIDADEFFASNLVPARFFIQQALDEVKLMRSGQYGYRIGLLSLNELVGLYPKELFLVAGRPGSGKSALALQLVEDVIVQMRKRQAEGRIAFFTMEMSPGQVMRREACAIIGVSSWTFRRGLATPEEYDQLETAISGLVKDRMHIDPSGAPTVEHIIEQLIALEEAGPIPLVVTDMFDLIDMTTVRGYEKAVKIGYALKNIAKRFNTTVLATIQMNREYEKRADKTPILSDIMNGGEQAADVVVALAHRNDMMGGVDAHVLKHRDGPTGKASLHFNAEAMRFSDTERHDLNPKTDDDE